MRVCESCIRRTVRIGGYAHKQSTCISNKLNPIHPKNKKALVIHLRAMCRLPSQGCICIADS